MYNVGSKVIKNYIKSIIPNTQDKQYWDCKSQTFGKAYANAIVIVDLWVTKQQVTQTLLS